MSTKLLTAADVQEILQVDRSTVYRMADNGRLPAIKVGRQWRFPVAQLDLWLADKGLDNQHRAAAPISGPEPLQDLIPIDCVQLIQDTFAEAVGAMIVITDMDGHPVTRVSNSCNLFAALQDSPLVWERCVQHWRQMAQTIDLEPRFTQSLLGLLCARGLIRTQSELKGIVFVGGFAPSDWPPAPPELARMVAELQLDPMLLAAHIDDVYTLDAAKEPAMLVLVQRIANIVSHIISEHGCGNTDLRDTSRAA